MDAPASTGAMTLFRTTTLTKGIFGVILAGFVAALVLPSIELYLGLVPGRTFPLVWNLVTSSFLITNPVELLLDGAALLLTLRIVEPAYGVRGLLLFLFVVSLLTGVLTFVTCFIAFFIVRRGKIFYQKISGCHGVVGGLLVAVKHVMPEQEVALFGTIKFKIKWLPSIFILVSVPLGFMINAFRTVPFVLYGTYSAWIYLRFFQLNEETRLRGAPGADFSFASFFPEAIQQQVNTIATIFSKVFGLGSWQNAQVEERNLEGQPLPGSDGIEAARRRERGAKALEDRLKKQGIAQDLERGP